MIDEIDRYTTQEEGVSYNAYIKMQQEKRNKVNQYLALQESLLLEAQEITEMGSFYVDFEHPENSVTTPQMVKLLGLPNSSPADTFFKYVHPDDVVELEKDWKRTFSEGASFDHSYTYIKDNVE